MFRNSRAWKMTKWDYAAETMFSTVEFLLSNAICAVGTMIASVWLAESLGRGGGFGFLDAFTLCAAIDLLVYRLLPGKSDRDLGKPYMERLGWGLVRDLVSVVAILGLCGLFALCVHYL